MNMIIKINSSSCSLCFMATGTKDGTPAADSKSEQEEEGKLVLSKRGAHDIGHVKKSCRLQHLMHCGPEDAGSANGGFGSRIGRHHVHLSCSSLAPGFAASQRTRTEPHRSAPLPTSSSFAAMTTFLELEL
ncbi:hypothetical protein BHE74_00029401 [Ensete ventricosum]|nr:hypothetical protein BHE74_00029401 [Ensete ventricosum]RZR86361.1 hypothetical protein BHM03_00013548 [Ensete ventricosum]